ncbi:unnamed protein product [Amoebophrya sp. A120]|nr:unnamed protein product [Amoebophrya sp. A120]|eukprot:GSA120T00014715001.1
MLKMTRFLNNHGCNYFVAAAGLGVGLLLQQEQLLSPFGVVVRAAFPAPRDFSPGRSSLSIEQEDDVNSRALVWLNENTTESFLQSLRDAVLKGTYNKEKKALMFATNMPSTYQSSKPPAGEVKQAFQKWLAKDGLQSELQSLFQHNTTSTSSSSAASASASLAAGPPMSFGPAGVRGGPPMKDLQRKKTTSPGGPVSVEEAIARILQATTAQDGGASTAATPPEEQAAVILDVSEALAEVKKQLTDAAVMSSKVDEFLSLAEKQMKTVQRTVHPDRFAMWLLRSKKSDGAGGAGGEEAVSLQPEDFTRASQAVLDALETLKRWGNQKKASAGPATQKAHALAQRLLGHDNGEAFATQMKHLLEGRSVEEVSFGPYRGQFPFNEFEFFHRNAPFERLEAAGVDWFRASAVVNGEMSVLLEEVTRAGLNLDEVAVLDEKGRPQRAYDLSGNETVLVDNAKYTSARLEKFDAENQHDEEIGHPIRVKGVRVLYNVVDPITTRTASVVEEDVAHVDTTKHRATPPLSKAKVQIRVQEKATGVFRENPFGAPTKKAKFPAVDAWLDLDDVSFARKETEGAVRKLCDMLNGLISVTEDNLKLVGAIGSTELMKTIGDSVGLGAIGDAASTRTKRRSRSPTGRERSSSSRGSRRRSSRSRSASPGQKNERAAQPATSSNALALSAQEVEALTKQAEEEKLQNLKNDGEQGFRKGVFFRLPAAASPSDVKQVRDILREGSQDYMGKVCQVTSWVVREKRFMGQTITTVRFDCFMDEKQQHKGEYSSFSVDEDEKLDMLRRLVTFIDNPAPAAMPRFNPDGTRALADGVRFLSLSG